MRRKRTLRLPSIPVFPASNRCIASLILLTISGGVLFLDLKKFILSKSSQFSSSRVRFRILMRSWVDIDWEWRGGTKDSKLKGWSRKGEIEIVCWFHQRIQRPNVCDRNDKSTVLVWCSSSSGSVREWEEIMVITWKVSKRKCRQRIDSRIWIEIKYDALQREQRTELRM